MIVPVQKEPDLAIAGLALIVIFGLLIWHDKPIQSDRPFDPAVMQPQYPHTTGYAYESWLWQDPFSVDSSEYIQKDQYHIELDFYKGDKSSWPKWLRLRKKLDLEGDHYSTRKTSGTEKDWQDDSLCSTQFDEHQRNYSTLRILLSLVNVRPNTVENKETRVRHRYAVTAGLIESRYYPSQPDRLYFCSSQSASSDRDRQFDVRWEHFSDANEENTIIVAWADSEVFKKNLEGKNVETVSFTSDINRLFAKDKGKVDDARDKIDKMNSSQHSSNATGAKPEKNDEHVQLPQTYQLFYEKNSQAKKQSNKNSYIFDWAGAIDTTDKLKADKLKKFVEVVQPAQTDKKLSEKLVKELKNREIDKPSDIAIITEQDSNTVRNLVQAFKNELPCTKNDNKENSDRSDEETNPESIRIFSYFKGLDAYQQVIDKREQNEEYQAAKKWEARLSVTDLHNPPVGPAQFDYLQRIAREIRQTHDVIDLEKRVAGVKAVGIFGSDFYDKLLILKALRTEMPNLLVFTTDLDAQMLHPQHWRWTRNLVVASPFGLRLNEQHHQKLFPAFRDSQQTEIFYQTLRFLESGKDNAETDEKSIEKPLIFEIGRNGPVRLALTESDSTVINCSNTPTDIHPCDKSKKQSEYRVWLLFSIVFALILAVANFRPNSGATLFFGLLLSSIVILALAMHLVTDIAGEPLSFTNGTSLWPTIFIQTIAILLALAFGLKGMFMLESNFASLNRQYFKNRRDLETYWSDQEPRSIRNFFKVNDSDRKTKASPFYFLAGFLIIASSIIYAVNDASPERAISFIVCVVLLMAMVTICFWIEYTRPFAIKAIIFWEESGSYHQDKKSNLSIDKIVFFSILFVLVFVSVYVTYLEQIDFKIWLNGIFVLVGTTIVIIIFVNFIDSCYPNKKTQAVNTQKFIIFQEDDGSGLWREYYQHGRFEQILYRVAVMWLFFAIIETILFYMLPPWPSPCRGDTCDLSWFVGILGFIFTMLLTFFVLDAVRLNYYLEFTQKFSVYLFTARKNSGMK
ncbi:hypothetical protein [Nitrosomonas sp.]|uniref:hypothetical protein n=1 Tax=Nitrosomonas sp. TaxID=42353 RepID=UPI0020838F3F|nr:hypothetical protein [Nitrosomonas sp.]GJL76832.1 MAG: hypothetical protein NMNS02_29380 [Nitrosomonas sp.]